jgi:hypothetical protein
LERTIVWKSINQSINQEEEPWAERRRDREIAFFVGIIIVGGFVLWS